MTKLWYFADMDKNQKNVEVKRIKYEPAETHPYGVEILRASKLLGSDDATLFSAPQQIDFYLLFSVTSGELHHTVDFIPYQVKVGEWLIVKPSQVQHFDLKCQWDGFVVPISSEFLEAAPNKNISSNEISLLQELQQIPTLLCLPETQANLCISTAIQMEEDALLIGPRLLIESLLKQQLRTLVSRLIISHQKNVDYIDKPAIAIMTFSKYRNAVDEHFRQLHHVHEYAALLGYSERTLSRASRLISDVTAKEIIDARITLEAKRLLTHSLMLANRIALELGFEDASHFFKFFKRNTGYSPSEFRQLQRKS